MIDDAVDIIGTAINFFAPVVLALVPNILVVAHPRLMLVAFVILRLVLTSAPSSAGSLDEGWQPRQSASWLVPTRTQPRSSLSGSLG